jgi:hypothetical protein
VAAGMAPGLVAAGVVQVGAAHAACCIHHRDAGDGILLRLIRGLETWCMPPARQRAAVQMQVAGLSVGL